MPTLHHNGMITNYAYNAANQLTGDGTNTYTYDANGNLISDGVNPYTWDRANRLLSFGGSSYQYNRIGHRVNQTIGATVTTYLLDTQPGLAKVIAADNGTTVNRYVHDMTGIHSHKDSAGNWEHVIQDGLGSVRGVYANDLSDLYTAQYSPYGEVLSSTGTPQTAFGYTGEWTDQNDLVHLRARYYDPVMGAFFNQDFLETPNRYNYVDGNPIDYTDPSGLCLLGKLPNGRCRGHEVTDTVSDAVDWAEEHPTEAVLIGAGVVAIAATGGAALALGLGGAFAAGVGTGALVGGAFGADHG